MTSVQHIGDKKICRRRLDLRLMSAAEAEWFVFWYDAFGRLLDAVSSWTGKWELKFRERILDDNKIQNELMQDINKECNVLVRKLTLVGNTEDKIKLGEDIVLELKQDNVDKINDIVVEKEREECELIMEKMLDEVRYLKENYENTRIEVEENINKLGKIHVIIERIESSMNEKGKKRKRERGRISRSC